MSIIYQNMRRLTFFRNSVGPVNLLPSVFWSLVITLLVFISILLANSAKAKSITDSRRWSLNRSPLAQAISPQEFMNSRVSRDFVVIDVRSRESFSEWHIGNSLNIPLVELDMRARSELAQDMSIVVFCDYSSKCTDVLRKSSQPTPCSDAAVLLKGQLGYKRVLVMAGSLRELSKAGVATEVSKQDYEHQYALMNP